MYSCNVKNILLDFTAENTSNDVITAVISLSTVFGDSLYWEDWIALKNPRSKTFNSGEFAG
ncbi:hypothetical protein Syun_009599 [Stephania yunnanensis]|uniref:Uncharacterized protein n=1 Tax=Stephania yunnanensis TaxID=152371 RepID=A0AAP0KHF8_9MAGN